MNRRRLAQEFKNSNEGWFFQIGSTNGNPISFFLSKISIIHRISNEKHQYGIDQLDLWQAPAIDTTKSMWCNRRFQINDFMAKVSRKMYHFRLIKKKQQHQQQHITRNWFLHGIKSNSLKDFSLLLSKSIQDWRHNRIRLAEYVCEALFLVLVS